MLRARHLLLAVLPGAVAFLAGVIMVSTAPRAVSGGGRGSLVMAGFLALLAGGWFVIGPLAATGLVLRGQLLVGRGHAAGARIPSGLRTRARPPDRADRRVRSRLVRPAPATRRRNGGQGRVKRAPSPQSSSSGGYRRPDGGSNFACRQPDGLDGASAADRPRQRAIF